jgi:tetratricopeptide (TPR) repeat protein
MRRFFQYDAFLCHSSKDKPLIGPLAKRLKSDRFRVWYDADEVQPGDPIQVKIDEGLEHSQVLILAMSTAFFEAEWPRFEAGAFRFRDPANRGRSFLPLLLDDAPVPIALQQFGYVDFRTSPDEAYAHLADALRGVCDRVWYPPRLERNPNFTGRVEILKAIREALLAHGGTTVTQPLALTGLGGIGKTQTAVEYAFCNQSDYRLIFLLHADDPHNMQNDYEGISELLDIGRHERAASARVDAVIRWMERTSGWLLIVDNVDHPAEVARLLPKSSDGHILVTSRIRDMKELGRTMSRPIELGRWTPNEARTYLVRDTGRSLKEASEAEAMDRIVDALDGLPLAHAQAAAFIRRLDVSFAAYWKEFSTRRTKLFAGSRAALPDYPHSVITTWLMNFEAVVREAKRSPREPASAAPDLLLATSFLSPEEIPVDILIAGGKELSPIVAAVFHAAEPGSLVVNEALHLLHKFSLIEIKDEGKAHSYRMHRLVQEVIRRWWMSDTERAEWAKRVIRMLDTATEYLDVHYGNWPSHLDKQHHANFLAKVMTDEWKRTDFQFDEAADFLTKTGFMFTNMGRYEEAKEFFALAKQTRETLLPPDDVRIAETLMYIADNLTENGETHLAIDYYDRALKIRKKQCGPDDTIVGQIHNSWGIALYKRGEYDDALQHHSEAKRIWELAHDSTLVGSALFNMAQVYADQGRRPEAEENFRASWLKISNSFMRATVGLRLATFIEGRVDDEQPATILREATACAQSGFGQESKEVLKYLVPRIPILRRLGRDDELAQVLALQKRILARHT